ncbi:UBP13, partial [Symbiodinium necroappetens]
MVLDPYTRSGDSVREDAPEGCPTSEFNKENLPPVMQNEIEFAIKDCRKYSCGTSVRSECKTVGNFRFRLLIFPGGTQTAGGQQVSAFVEADPVEGLDPRWCFHGVKYQISLVNWTDYRRSVTKSDIWSFSRDGIDRGWHDMVRVAELMPESGWLGPDNTLLFRAACYVRAADQLNLPNDYSCKKETGFTGLKNHGAT